MSTSAILPISAVSAPNPIDYNSASATTAQQAVFNSVLNQLQQSVSQGDLTSSQTLLNAVEAISPSASTGTTPLATFLSNLSSALSNNSISDAQEALASYQQSASSSSSLPLIPTANAAAEAAQITARVVKNASELFIADTHPKPAPQANHSNSPASSSAISNLMKILNAAYPATSAAPVTTPVQAVSSVHAASSSSATAATQQTASPSNAAEATAPATNPSAAVYSAPAAAASSTPYDTLVASIQASLAGGNGTLTPALAYLQAAGNFINTSA